MLLPSSLFSKYRRACSPLPQYFLEFGIMHALIDFSSRGITGMQWNFRFNMLPNKNYYAYFLFPKLTDELFRWRNGPHEPSPMKRLRPHIGSSMWWMSKLHALPFHSNALGSIWIFCFVGFLDLSWYFLLMSYCSPGLKFLILSLRCLVNWNRLLTN